MGNEWLQPGETEAGSWSVYIGEAGVNTAKVTGKIHVTNLNVHFAAGMSLEKNAATLMTTHHHIKAFQKSDEHLTIPLAEIAGGAVVKEGFLQKALVLKLKSGEELPFHFGAVNPQKALDAITAGLK